MHLVGLVELGADVAAEKVAGAARRQAPALDVLRVAPQQVAHGAVVRHLLLPVDRPDLRIGTFSDVNVWSCHAVDLPCLNSWFALFGLKERIDRS